jgi:hypothetical protein
MPCYADAFTLMIFHFRRWRISFAFDTPLLMLMPCHYAITPLRRFSPLMPPLYYYAFH